MIGEHMTYWYVLCHIHVDAHIDFRCMKQTISFAFATIPTSSPCIRTGRMCHPPDCTTNPLCSSSRKLLLELLEQVCVCIFVARQKVSRLVFFRISMFILFLQLWRHEVCWHVPIRRSLRSHRSVLEGCKHPVCALLFLFLLGMCVKIYQ